MSFCLILHLSSLSCVFVSTVSPFFLSYFFQFFLCASCVGLTVKGLGFLGLQTFGQQQRVVRLMSWERATGLYRQPLTGQTWNPSRCPISPFLTLLFLLCVGGLWVETETHRFISLADEMPVCLQTFVIFFILFIVFPLRLVPCNVNHVRSWHKKSERKWENKWGQVRCLVCTAYLYWISAIDELASLIMSLSLLSKTVSTWVSAYPLMGSTYQTS